MAEVEWRPSSDAAEVGLRAGQLELRANSNDRALPIGRRTCRFGSARIQRTWVAESSIASIVRHLLIHVAPEFGRAVGADVAEWREGRERLEMEVGGTPVHSIAAA